MCPTNWSIAGTGDFNGDGKSDILWRDTSGDTVIWFMNGGPIIGCPDSRQRAHHLVHRRNRRLQRRRQERHSLARHQRQRGDLVHERRDDLRQSVVGNVPTNWSIAGTGDFNGDGKSDILWRDTTTGETAIWFMNGGTMTSFADFGTVPNIWAIQGANAN